VTGFTRLDDNIYANRYVGRKNVKVLYPSFIAPMKYVGRKENTCFYIDHASSL
jgi:hypothetical protein